jgi:hypothetical protein
MPHNDDRYSRPFPVSKDGLDTVNSMTWFFADAMWMLGFHSTAMALLVPTIITGFLLLYIEKRLPLTFINLAINCWIWMNTFWVAAEWRSQAHLQDLSRGIFVLGVLFILGAAITSRNVRETFSHFRRFRTMKLK